MVKPIEEIITHNTGDVYGKFHIIQNKKPYTVEGVLLKQSGFMGELTLAVGTPDGIITDLQCTIVSVEEIKHDNLDEYKKKVNVKKQIQLESTKPYVYVDCNGIDLYVLINNNYVSIKEGRILDRFMIKFEKPLQQTTHNEIIKVLDNIKDTMPYEENLQYFAKLGDLMDIVTPLHRAELAQEINAMLGVELKGGRMLTLEVPFATKAWMEHKEKQGETVAPSPNRELFVVLKQMFDTHHLQMYKDVTLEASKDDYVLSYTIVIRHLSTMSLSKAKEYVHSLKNHVTDVITIGQQTRHKMR